MKVLRENTQNKFEEMRDRARREMRCKDSVTVSGMGNMSSLKSFGELNDSILKLRENFDSMIGKYQNLHHISPLKKKDLMNDFGSTLGGAALKDCETDEDEGEIIKVTNKGGV